MRTTTFRRYWDLIRDRWKGEGVPAEVWATGLWLHRRRRRYLRLGWRIVGGITVACLMLGGLLAVLDLGLGMRIVLGHMLYEWLSWLVGIVLAVYGASILPMLWIIGIDLINFHRLYHLPVSSYDAAAGERDEEIAKQ